MKTNLKLSAAFLASGLALAAPATQAADWSDTYIGYRYGTQFREPSNSNDITKNVLQLTHSSGYSLGQNFINLDVLKSSEEDPAAGPAFGQPGATGATELYLTYRHQLSLGKVTGNNLAFGPVKDVAISAGIELNTKNTGFAPAKRLLVVGPTLKFNVPGFLDVSLLAGQEKNHCGLSFCTNKNVTFDTQWIVGASWGIPFQIGSLPLKFQGFANYSSKKGKDYTGTETQAETLMRTSLMADVGQLASSKKNTVFVGVGYEYWNHKFGNPDPRGRTHTPTLQAEWHF